VQLNRCAFVALTSAGRMPSHIMTESAGHRWDTVKLSSFPLRRAQRLASALSIALPLPRGHNLAVHMRMSARIDAWKGCALLAWLDADLLLTLPRL
jgi:hypothetical protein